MFFLREYCSDLENFTYLKESATQSPELNGFYKLITEFGFFGFLQPFGFWHCTSKKKRSTNSEQLIMHRKKSLK
jgi:hypothetical protein